MKMNLSVVMDIVDKVKGPLKGMASDSDRYAKKINEIKKAQSDDSAALHLIDSYKAIGKEVDKSALSLNEAKDKLTALQAKETSATNAKKALNTELERQVKRLAKLKAHSDAAGGSNKKLNKMVLEQSKALKKLRAEAAAAHRPNHALTNQLAKQAEKVTKLTDAHNEHAERLRVANKEMKKAKVDTNKLDDEFSRLTSRFQLHAKEIDVVSRKYKALNSLMTPMQKINKKIALPSFDVIKNGAMAGGAALGSVAGFGAIITDTAAQVNELSRAAKSVAMPVEELQAMRLQATDAGAEVEDMDAAIKEMNIRWGEMKALKSGAMNDYFKDTGNKQAYKELMRAKNSMEAYQVLVREITKETDVAKQNFMADEFFGGDSEKILSVLKSGTDGLERAREKLNDTGGPITQDSIDSAKAFGSTLKTLSAIINSLKISALTPIMKELSVIFGNLAEKMKNIQWRNEAIEKLRITVKRVFTAFKALGNGILFLSENFKTIIATIALLKIGFFALNAVMYANPIGAIVGGVMAAVAAVGVLYAYFNDLGSIMNRIGSFFGWGDEDNKAIKKVDELSNKIGDLKDKSIELGIITNETTNKHTSTSDKASLMKYQEMTPVRKVAPLTTQNIKSQAEVALTIKSDKPVTVDKINSDKGTNLNIDVGNMMMSY